MPTTTRTIAIPQQLDPVTVLGPVDEVLREVERAFPDLTIIVRGNRSSIDAAINALLLWIGDIPSLTAEHRLKIGRAHV